MNRRARNSSRTRRRPGHRRWWVELRARGVGGARRARDCGERPGPGHGGDGAQSRQSVGHPRQRLRPGEQCRGGHRGQQFRGREPRPPGAGLRPECGATAARHPGGRARVTAARRGRWADAASSAAQYDGCLRLSNHGSGSALGFTRKLRWGTNRRVDAAPIREPPTPEHWNESFSPPAPSQSGRRR